MIGTIPMLWKNGLGNLSQSLINSAVVWWKNDLQSSQMYLYISKGIWQNDLEFVAHFERKKKCSRPSAKVLKGSQVEHRHSKPFPGTLDCCQQKEKYTLWGETRSEKGSGNP